MVVCDALNWHKFDAFEQKTNNLRQEHKKPLNAKYLSKELYEEVDTSSFRGELSIAAYYQLLDTVIDEANSMVSGTRYEGAEVKVLDELASAGLISFTTNEVSEGSPEMLGMWASKTLTEKGKSLAKELSLFPDN